MIDTYTAEITSAADSKRGPSPVQLAQAQREMWARHRCNAWQSAPLGKLSATMVGRRARTVESRV